MKYVSDVIFTNIHSEQYDDDGYYYDYYDGNESDPYLYASISIVEYDVWEYL